MYDDINGLIYYGYFMENFKNFMNMFTGAKKEAKKAQKVPSYIKSDGTKVYEEVFEYGKKVFEIRPDGLVISRTYSPDDKLVFSYGRKANYEIGTSYDDDGKVTCEVTNLYNEHNVQVRNTQVEFEYHDNGEKSREFTTVLPSDEKTEILYDEGGKRTEKIVYKGSVKTWYDENDKPFKRQIDRGSGGIITENL